MKPGRKIIQNSMENETEKIIEGQLKKLPTSLQQAINAVPWRSYVREIGGDSGLDSSQIDTLEEETLLVISGLESLTDYPENLIRKMHVEEDIAYIIAEDVVEEVLNLIQQKAEEITTRGEQGHPIEVKEDIIVPRQPVSLPQTETPKPIPETHLTTVPGEEAHEVKEEAKPTDSAPIQQKKEFTKPDIAIPQQNHYPPGQDPYREPIQ